MFSLTIQGDYPDRTRCT